MSAFQNIFAELELKKEWAQQEGRTVVDMGEASPKEPTPPDIVESLRRAALNPQNHTHSPFRGTPDFLEAMSDWYSYRYRVEIDPKREVHALLGSKEGLFTLASALLRPGDVGLIPEPGYPTYYHAVEAAGAEIFRLRLRPENQYLPDFDQIPNDILKRSKLLYLNYPHNPTGAVPPDDFFPKAIQFAKKHKIVICYDNAFAEIVFDGRRSRSFLEFEGAKEVGIESFTFSKIFNMTGWRLGAFIGNADILEKFEKHHSKIQSGVFKAIQIAGITALNDIGKSNYIAETCAKYQQKRDYAMKKFKEVNWSVISPQGTVFLWVPVPQGMTSESFADHLLDHYNVLVSRGTGFGDLGQGFIRISMTLAPKEVEKGVDLVCHALKKQSSSSLVRF